MPPIEQSIKEKIERIGTPLTEWNVKIYRGVLTGYNDAFIINSHVRDELISADSKSAEIIRPILRGRDIKRYECNYAELYLIATFPSKKYDIEDYPAVKKHLLSFGIERLEQTGAEHGMSSEQIKSRKKTNNKWFETQDSISYWDDFSKQKIVWGEISDKPKFALDETGEFFTEATTFMMTGEILKYLLGFLNSTVSEYFFSKIGTTTGVGTVRWKKFKIGMLPIPIISFDLQQIFIGAVSEILDAKKNNISTNILEETLDDMVYSFFGLNAEEIQLIQEYCHN